LPGSACRMDAARSAPGSIVVEALAGQGGSLPGIHGLVVQPLTSNLQEEVALPEGRRRAGPRPGWRSPERLQGQRRQDGDGAAGLAPRSSQDLVDRQLDLGQRCR
jgi:hypothetical protein